MVSLPFPVILLMLTLDCREIPTRDRQSRWPHTITPPPSFIISAPHPLRGCMRSQRVHPPCQRISDHRFWFPTAIDRTSILRRERGSSMPRNQHSAELGSQQRTQQDCHCGSRRCRAYQAAGFDRAIGSTKRDDRLRCRPRAQWSVNRIASLRHRLIASIRR